MILSSHYILWYIYIFTHKLVISLVTRYCKLLYKNAPGQYKANSLGLRGRRGGRATLPGRKEKKRAEI